MKSWLSLRLLLPMIISAITLVVIGFSYYSSRVRVMDVIAENNHVIVKTRLNFIQGVVEKFLREEQVESVRAIIASIASEPDLIKFVVVSPMGRVLAANTFSDVEKPWTMLDTKPDSNTVIGVKRRQTIETVLSQDRQYLDGYASLCNIDKQIQHKRDCGFIFYRIDMAYHYGLDVQSLREQAVLISAGTIFGLIILLALIHLLITQRVTQLIHDLEDFAEGDRTVRSQLRGFDELSWLSRSINHLMMTIAADERTIMEKQQRLDSIFHTVVDSIITFDSDGNIYQANLATEALFGYSREEIRSDNIRSLVPDFDLDFDDDDEQREQAFHCTRQLTAKTRLGREFLAQIVIARMDNSLDRLYTAVIRDITEQKMLEQNLRSKNQRLEASANTDSLTGLANRRCYDLTIKSEINRATRSGLPLSMLVCDVDHFKQYNDNFGHAAGDECLLRIANVMRGLFTRAGDLPCRYGGEEFAIILPSVDAEKAVKTAEILAENIRQLNIPHPYSSVVDYVTISIGCATYSPDSSIPPDAKLLFETADLALYDAKSNGRNQVVSRSLAETAEIPLQQRVASIG